MNYALLVAASMCLTLLLPLTMFSQSAMEEISREKILAAGSEWQENFDKYDPPSDMVEALKSKLGPEMKVEVYLGLWCKDSRVNVPAFIKIIDRASPAAKVRYFDVPKKESKEIQYFIQELKIDRVPAFIIYRDGKEIGRIVENPKVGMAEDLMEILFR